MALVRNDQSAMAATRRDLNAVGQALGAFTSPDIRGSLGSGHLKLAASLTAPDLAKEPGFALASLNELRQVAVHVGLPSCALG